MMLMSAATPASGTFPVASVAQATETPFATAERVFPVLLGRREAVESALTNLTKRATRKGLPVLTWSWGKAYTTTQHQNPETMCGGPGCRGCMKISRIPLTLVGDTPKYAGWTFLAALEHMDGENIVRSVPGETAPETYRTRGPVCDHCNMARKRNETYVLRHDDGRVTQVGSTCIGDFLGHDDAGKLAASASYVAAMRGCAEEGLEGFGRVSNDLFLGDYLPMVAWCVREQGWVSRTAVRESGGVATADRALSYIYDHKMATEADANPTEEDGATAAAAALWAENLSDADLAKETGDYLHNLRVIGRNGVVSPKSAGLAASMVVAYQRATAKAAARAERAARKPSEFVGTVKSRETFKNVTLDFVTGYETDYGYTTVLKFLTEEGNLLVWKSTSTDVSRQDVGKKYDLTGTVKAHDEYKGQKQTMVLRCKLVDLTPKAETAIEEK
jgi:hypothetical protein